MLVRHWAQARPLCGTDCRVWGQLGSRHPASGRGRLSHFPGPYFLSLEGTAQALPGDRRGETQNLVLGNPVLTTAHPAQTLVSIRKAGSQMTASQGSLWARVAQYP